MPKVCIQNVLLHAVKERWSWTRCTQAVNSYASHSIYIDSSRAVHFACVGTLCVLPVDTNRQCPCYAVLSALKQTVPDWPFCTQVDGAF
jgi:hypothetical protein